VSTARERAGLCELRRGRVSVGASEAQKGSWGTWAGVVAEDFGDVRECARAGPRRGAERAELTAQAHGAERGTTGAGGNGSVSGRGGPVR
jgi:hypothetical protein